MQNKEEISSFKIKTRSEKWLREEKKLKKLQERKLRLEEKKLKKQLREEKEDKFLISTHSDMSFFLS